MATLKKTVGSDPRPAPKFFRRPIGRVVLALAAICAAACGSAAIVNARKPRQAHAA